MIQNETAFISRGDALGKVSAVSVPDRPVHGESIKLCSNSGGITMVSWCRYESRTMELFMEHRHRATQNHQWSQAKRNLEHCLHVSMSLASELFITSATDATDTHIEYLLTSSLFFFFSSFWRPACTYRECAAKLRERALHFLQRTSVFVWIHLKCREEHVGNCVQKANPETKDGCRFGVDAHITIPGTACSSSSARNNRKFFKIKWLSFGPRFASHQRTMLTSSQYWQGLGMNWHSSRWRSSSPGLTSAWQPFSLFGQLTRFSGHVSTCFWKEEKVLLCWWLHFSSVPSAEQIASVTFSGKKKQEQEL